MGTPHTKYYVVWVGRHPGVFDNWEDARIQVENYPGARFKSFKTKEAAVAAFRQPAAGEENHMARLLLSKIAGGEKSSPQRGASKPASGSKAVPQRNPGSWLRHPGVDPKAWAVDASCPGNPGPMEYRGVEVATGREIFRVGPLQGGTNNIGEYLAIIHALALMARSGERHPIYTDSITALSWIRRKKANTKIIPSRENREVVDLLVRGNIWIGRNAVEVPLLKWDTASWGEIPADFGRKG